jgi:hypothetical protein
MEEEWKRNGRGMEVALLEARAVRPRFDAHPTLNYYFFDG